MNTQTPYRVLVTKVGLDGHDRGSRGIDRFGRWCDDGAVHRDRVLIVFLNLGDPPVVVGRLGTDTVGADSYTGPEEDLANARGTGLFHVRFPGDGVAIARDFY